MPTRRVCCTLGAQHTKDETMTTQTHEAALIQTAPLDPGAVPSRGTVLWSLAPIGAFVLAHETMGLVAAVVAASLLSVFVAIRRRRQSQRVGVVLVASLAYVLVRGVAAIIADSEDVFFGFGLVLSATTAVAIGATAFTSRPAAVHVIPLVARYRASTVAHPLYRTVAAQLTVAWALMEVALTAWEAWHLTAVDVSDFVMLRTFVGWPVMAVWIFFLIFYLRLRLDPLQFALAGDTPPRWGNAAAQQ